MKKNKSERVSTSIFKKILSGSIAIVLLVIQATIYYLIFFEAQKIPHIYIISLIVAIFIAIYIYNSNQNTSYKLTWIIVVLSLQFFGPVFYLLFANGTRLPFRKARKIHAYLEKKLDTNDYLPALEAKDPVAAKFVKLLHEQTKFPLYRAAEEEYFSDGAPFFASMLRDIEQARQFIFIEFFILRDGVMLNRLMEALEKKALEGVSIKIIYDAIGAGGSLRKKTIRHLKQTENIEIVCYNPLGVNFSLAFNYRDHRKIVVIDGWTSYVGGVNIADEYIHEKVRFGHWRDNGMLLRGQATYSYTLLFAEMWYLSTKEMLDMEQYRPKKTEIKLQDGYVFPFGDGPIDHVDPAYDLMLNMINHAQEYIYISTPYFIIDQEFIYALVKAIKSGVKVKILLPGIPDKKSVFQVSRSHYKAILYAGGEIYEYTPGFNHAKLISVDGKYAFVGTVNVDYRSMFLHFECGNFLVHTKSISKIEQDMEESIAKSKLIELEEWKKRSILLKIFTFLVTIFGPLL